MALVHQQQYVITHAWVIFSLRRAAFGHVSRRVISCFAISSLPPAIIHHLTSFPQDFGELFGNGQTPFYTKVYGGTPLDGRRNTNTR